MQLWIRFHAANDEVRKRDINTCQDMHPIVAQGLERDVTQWLERGTLPMSLRAVSKPLDVGFLKKYNVYPLPILGHRYNVVSLGNTLFPHMLHLTLV